MTREEPESAMWETDIITCLVLACKFWERDDYVPLISDMVRWVYLNQDKISSHINQSIDSAQIRANESKILKLLQWDVNRVTVF